MLANEMKGSTTHRVLWAVLSIGFGIAAGFFARDIVNPLVILIVLAGVVILVITLYDVEWGLLAMVALVYLRLSDIGVHFYNAPSILQPFLGLLAGVILLRWILVNDRPEGWERTFILLTAYGVVFGASLLYAVNFDKSMESLQDYIKDAAIALLLVLLIRRISTLRNVIWTLLMVGLFVSLINIFQFYTGTFTNAYYGFAQADMQSILGNTDDWRIAGPIGDPNYFALILLVLVPMAMERTMNEKRLVLKILAGIALVAIFLTVILTYSRGAFVALIIVGGIMVLRTPGKPLPFLLIGALLVFLAIQFAPPNYTARMRTIFSILPGNQERFSKDYSIDARSSEFIISLEMFKDNPLFGVGKNNYTSRYIEYSIKTGADPTRIATAPHNLYFEALAETGLFGFLIFMYIVYQMVFQLFSAHQKLKEIKMHDKGKLLRGVIYGILAYLAGSLFLHAAYARYFWLLFGIAMASENIVRNEIQAWQDEGQEIEFD
jgi:putative inorganic carbon (HCO3(-)) transporter